MSIQTITKTFNINFTNLIISDFIIDSEDTNVIFNNDNTKKFTLETPTIKVNIIKFDEDKHYRLSSFVLFEKELQENIEWETIQKIEVDYCMILILNEDNLKNTDLDDWLEKCIILKELYKIEDDGRICLYSGFGPGEYKLLGSKTNDKITALKIEFIKENTS